MNRWKKKIGDVHLMNKNETLCGIPMLGNNYAIENEQITCETCKQNVYNNLTEEFKTKIKNYDNIN